MTNRDLAAHERQRLESSRGELLEWASGAIREDGTVDLPEGLRLFRASSTTGLTHGISYPALCLIVQGSKEVVLGSDVYRYDANHYLITAAALPTESRFTEASAERPCLGVVIRLEPAAVGSVVAETARPGERTQTSVRAFSVSPLDAGLLDAVLRLVKLQGVPADEAGFLRPLVLRELVFRLLKGEQGGWLRHTAVLGGQGHRIAGALERLQKEFRQPLRVEDFAREVGMSVSSFHHHFKAVTAMSPVQFQKRMRLQEARRLMFSENMGAARAGFRVGYDDLSHFSREYKRHFGQPPRRDVQRLRETGAAAGAEV